MFLRRRPCRRRSPFASMPGGDLESGPAIVIRLSGQSRLTHSISAPPFVCSGIFQNNAPYSLNGAFSLLSGSNSAARHRSGSFPIMVIGVGLPIFNRFFLRVEGPNVSPTGPLFSRTQGRQIRENLNIIFLDNTFPCRNWLYGFLDFRYFPKASPPTTDNECVKMFARHGSTAICPAFITRRHCLVDLGFGKKGGADG